MRPERTGLAASFGSMRRLVVSIGVAAALALTACGGGSSDKKAAATTVPPATTVVTSPPTTIPHGNDQAATPFCKTITPYIQNSDNLLASISDPVKLKAVSTDASTAITQAKDTAPAAIKSDVTTVANTLSQVLAALQKVNFVFANANPSDVAKLQDPAFQASLTKVSDYATAHCGVS
jgi:ABC-type glycerol-3-phosphate transport system substrate-binding protein